MNNLTAKNPLHNSRRWGRVFHLFTFSPLHLFTFSPLLLFTFSPLHLFTSSPLHLFTFSPFHLSIVNCQLFPPPNPRQRGRGNYPVAASGDTPSKIEGELFGHKATFFHLCEPAVALAAGFLSVEGKFLRYKN